MSDSVLAALISAGSTVLVGAASILVTIVKVGDVHKAVDGQSEQLATTNETLQTALLSKIATPTPPDSGEPRL